MTPFNQTKRQMTKKASKDREFIPKAEAIAEIEKFLSAEDISGVLHLKVIAKCRDSKRSIAWGDGRKHAIRVR